MKVVISESDLRLLIEVSSRAPDGMKLILALGQDSEALRLFTDMGVLHIDFPDADTKKISVNAQKLKEWEEALDEVC